MIETRTGVESDFAFHVALCELSGNRFVAQHGRQLLVLCFAFTLIRANKIPGGVAGWTANMDKHALIVSSIRSGDPDFAQQTTMHVLLGFHKVATELWAGEPVGEPVRGKDRSRRNRS